MAKKSSDVIFWAKHIGLAIVLIIVAAVVISMQHSNVTTPQPEGVKQKKTVSQGMTDFYAAHRMSSTQPFREDIGDFVLEVNEEETPLGDRLKNMESLQKPVSSRWSGEHKYRSFKAGSTLREAITEFAQLEGMQVIWELNRDFVVKHHFQMENTVIGSLQKIASAIDASFEGDVKVYVCTKQRSLVITAKSTEYLMRNCRDISPS